MSARDSGRILLLRSGVCLAGLLAAFSVSAADDLDVTMRMVLDDNELTEQVVREIELPVPDSVQRNDRSGLQGNARSEEARQSGRDFGQSVAEDARDARESLEQVKDRPEKPQMPEKPVKPERPTTPEKPEKPELPDAVGDIQENGPPGLNR